MRPTGMVLAQGALKAVKDRPSLWLTGVTATGAVVVQSWSLLAVSAAGYFALVLWNLTRARFWRQLATDLRRRSPPLPDPTAFNDSVARHFLNRLCDAREELKRVLGRKKEGTPEWLLARMEIVRQMEERAIGLISRVEDLSRYLSDKSPYRLQTEIERLARACQLATNPRLKDEYTRARVALQEELSALREIMAAREMLVARLETIAGTLEMFPCQIVRLRVLDIGAADDGIGDPWHDPHTFVADTDTLDDILAEGQQAAAEPESPVREPRREARGAPAFASPGALDA